MANELYFLVDLRLRRLVAEDPAKVIHLGRNQLVVSGEEALTEFDCTGPKVDQDAPPS